jgi:hypothetical protein
MYGYVLLMRSLSSRRVNFLTVALVQPIEEQDAPFTVHPQAVNTGYLPGPVAINYRREHILYRDLPSLWLATTRPVANDPALVDVVRGMKGMVTEARVERKDRSQNREESRHPKIVREKMGDTITDRLLLLCRATCDEELRGVSE